MQNHKKNLWLVALAGALALGFASGCTEPEGTTTGVTPGVGTPQPTKVDVKTWTTVNKAAFGGSEKINSLTVSGDGKWVYVVAEDLKKLYGVDVDTGFAHAADKDKWKDIGTKKTGDDAKAGEAKLDGADAEFALVRPSLKGAVVTILSSANDENGVALLYGNTYKSAWKSLKGKVTHIPDINKDNAEVYGLVISKGDTKDEYIYIYSTDKKEAYTTDAEKIPDDGVLKKALTETLKEKGDFAMSPILISGGVKDKNFVITEKGIGVLKDTEVGADATVNPAGEFASDKWVLETGKAQKAPTSAEVSGTDLYIGQKSTGTDNGGVVVFDFSAGQDKIKAVDKNWKGVNVLSLTKDKAGKVWAVTKDALILVEKDGRKGTVLSNTEVQKGLATDKTGGYVGKMPEADIVGAAWVGADNNLVIATKTGIHTMVVTKKDVQQ